MMAFERGGTYGQPHDGQHNSGPLWTHLSTVEIANSTSGMSGPNMRCTCNMTCAQQAQHLMSCPSQKAETLLHARYNTFIRSAGMQASRSTTTAYSAKSNLSVIRSHVSSSGAMVPAHLHVHHKQAHMMPKGCCDDRLLYRIGSTVPAVHIKCST